jgi:hypothetical protein
MNKNCVLVVKYSNKLLNITIVTARPSHEAQDIFEQSKQVIDNLH